MSLGRAESLVQGILTDVTANPPSPTPLTLRVASNLKTQVRRPGLVGKVRTETRYREADHTRRLLIPAWVPPVSPRPSGTSGPREAAPVPAQGRGGGAPFSGSSIGSRLLCFKLNPRRAWAFKSQRETLPRAARPRDPRRGVAPPRAARLPSPPPATGL